MNPSAASLCPSCSQPPDPGSPAGLCPRCLLAGAMIPTADGGSETRERPAAPAIEELAPLFPQLEIQALIGEGGMSAVYRAVQPRLGRRVALKILPASLSQDPAFARRFAREGQLLARLNHPGIVAVHDFGQAGGYFYLIMEHVDGVNLRQAMRSAPFTPVQALGIVPRICEALQYAHEEGVLHRDIKPENILLDQKGRVKLADFGIAKLISEPDPTAPATSGPAAAELSLTNAGSTLGTPDYMAPEQRDAPAGVDLRADIYSLGVVFYEMLTGGRPGQSFVPPSTLTTVDPGVDAIVRQALESERSRRQGSADELKTQVQSLMKSAPAAPLSVTSGPQPWYRRPFEYQSPTVLFGWPLLHVSTLRDPGTGKIKTARGIIAVGNRARGWLAFGGRAHGFIAFGGLATGVVACGGLAVGIVGIGGLGLGLLLGFDGLAAGLHAIGGFALGWHAAGGLAVGWFAFGGKAFGHIAAGGMVHADHVIQNLSRLPPGVISLERFMSWMGIFSFIWLIPLAAQMGIVWMASRLSRKPAAPIDLAKPLSLTGKSVAGLGIVGLMASLAMAWLIQKDPSWNPAPAEAFTAVALPASALLLLVTGWFLTKLAAKNRTADPLPPRLLKILKSLAWAGVIAFAIRDAFLQAYRVQSHTHSPELRYGSLVAVWKPVRHFAPGDLVTYPSRQIFRVGRIVEVRPESLLIDRKELPPEVVPRTDVIGRVVLNTLPTIVPGSGSKP